MSFLLDTCVLSELVKPRPNTGLCEWVAAREEHRLFLSVVTIGELRKGIAKLAQGQKRTSLRQWLDIDLLSRFHGRIVGVDLAVAGEWGAMLGEAELRGRPLPAIDVLIAATAKVHGHIVVTRNAKDIEPTGVEVIDPWT